MLWQTHLKLLASILHIHTHTALVSSSTHTCSNFTHMKRNLYAHATSIHPHMHILPTNWPPVLPRTAPYCPSCPLIQRQHYNRRLSSHHNPQNRQSTMSRPCVFHCYFRAGFGRQLIYGRLPTISSTLSICINAEQKQKSILLVRASINNQSIEMFNKNWCTLTHSTRRKALRRRTINLCNNKQKLWLRATATGPSTRWIKYALSRTKRQTSSHPRTDQHVQPMQQYLNKTQFNRIIVLCVKLYR